MVEKSCYTPIQSYFRDRFLFLLFSILCLLVIAPIFKGFVGIRLLMGIFTTAILISGVYAVSRKMSVTITASLLALPMFISTWTTFFIKIPSLSIVGDSFGILFMAFEVVVILSFVFREGEVYSQCYLWFNRCLSAYCHNVGICIFCS